MPAKRRKLSAGPKTAADSASLAKRLDTAIGYHRAGKLEAAEPIYRQILAQNPEQPDALNLLGVLTAQSGNPLLAVDYLQRAVKLSRQNPEFRYNLGKACHAADDLDAAIKHFRRAIELKGDYAEALKSLGAALIVRNRLAEAEACCRKCVRLTPRDPAAHNNLAMVLLARQAFDEAEVSAREAVRQKPDYAEALNNLGGALLGQEEFDQAARWFREALRSAPGYPEAHNNLGLALLGQGRIEEAISSFGEAARLRPTYADPHANLGNTHREIGNLSDAIEAYREALRIKPDSAKTLASLGGALIDRGDFDAAEAHYEQWLQGHPDSPLALVGTAVLLELLGDFDASYAIVARAVAAADPTAAVACIFGRLAPRYGKSDDAISLAENMLARPDLSNDERHLLHFNLGKLYDADDAFDGAFEHFAAGNALKTTQFDPQRSAAMVERAISYYGARNVARLPRAGNASEVPVFIVGMPRSGTTLVEQILHSHPAVHGAGELEDIDRLVRSRAGGAPVGDAYPECLAGLDHAALDAIAETYLSKLRTLGADALRVTDKMPYNFLYLGLIGQLFPGTRVIHCIRDPLDTCLSCFFQSFRRANVQTYDLRHLGHYYRQYEQLMRHWRAVLDIPIFDLHYERLVASPEEISRALVDFVGLEWDAACLRFYDSKRVVNTASYDQVRQPIYSRSIGRWRHYERQLGPLIEALAEAT